MNIINRSHLFFMFCIVLFCVISLSIVYAALNATLNITGTADVVASTWDVHFENAEFVSSLSSDGNYNVLPLAIWEKSDTVTISSDNTISFVTANLKKPGDYKIIQFDVVNFGTIDAKIENTFLSNLSTEQDVYINYSVQYEDGSTPKSGDILSFGERKTLNLVLEYDDDINAEQLPTSNQNLNLTYTMNYIQN